MIRNGISRKLRWSFRGTRLGAFFDRYNITSYDDLVEAGEKIRDGRERIKRQAKEFDHRTATASEEISADDKTDPVN